MTLGLTYPGRWSAIQVGALARPVKESYDSLHALE
jgi:hypothetical protein